MPMATIIIDGGQSSDFAFQSQTRPHAYGDVLEGYLAKTAERRFNLKRDPMPMATWKARSNMEVFGSFQSQTRPHAYGDVSRWLPRPRCHTGFNLKRDPMPMATAMTIIDGKG